MSLSGCTRFAQAHTGGTKINGPDRGERHTDRACPECHASLVTDGVDVWCSACGTLTDW